MHILMEATGLSLRYCSMIRRGLYVPNGATKAANRKLKGFTHSA